MSESKETILIVGCGDVGRAVARYWLGKNAEVYGLVRSRQSEKKLTALGIRCIGADLDGTLPLDIGDLSVHYVYYFVPPPANGLQDSRLLNFLAALNHVPHKIILISTTGVYGDCLGQWVNESHPTDPVSNRSKRRLNAEDVVSCWCADRNTSSVILRVAGIYGPGRLPVNRLRKQIPMLAEPDCGYTNRIHIEDLVEVCIKACLKEDAKGIYNVSDGHPGTMREYFDCVAEKLGMKKLPLITLEHAESLLSREMWDYLRQSRKIDNTRMLKLLGAPLKYPDLDKGLDGIQKSVIN